MQRAPHRASSSSRRASRSSASRISACGTRRRGRRAQRQHRRAARRGVDRKGGAAHRAGVRRRPAEQADQAVRVELMATRQARARRAGRRARRLRRIEDSLEADHALGRALGELREQPAREVDRRGGVGVEEVVARPGEPARRCMRRIRAHRGLVVRPDFEHCKNRRECLRIFRGALSKQTAATVVANRLRTTCARNRRTAPRSSAPQGTSGVRSMSGTTAPPAARAPAGPPEQSHSVHMRVSRCKQRCGLAARLLRAAHKDGMRARSWCEGAVNEIARTRKARTYVGELKLNPAQHERAHEFAELTSSAVLGGIGRGSEREPRPWARRRISAASASAA